MSSTPDDRTRYLTAIGFDPQRKSRQLWDGNTSWRGHEVHDAFQYAWQESALNTFRALAPYLPKELLGPRSDDPDDDEGDDLFSTPTMRQYVHVLDILGEDFKATGCRRFDASPYAYDENDGLPGTVRRAYDTGFHFGVDATMIAIWTHLKGTP